MRSSARDANELLHAAQTAHANAQLSSSEGFCRQVLDMRPGDLRARLLLGVLSVKLERNEEARSLLEGVLSENDSSYEALAWLSILNRRQHRFEEASDLARRMVDLRPQDPHAHNNLGMVLMELEDSIGAVQSFAKAASLNPQLASLHYNLGTALLQQQKDEEAERAFRRALALSPTPEALLGLARSLFRINQMVDAENSAQAALLAKPHFASAHMLLANILASEGRAEEAEGHLRQALSLEPHSFEEHNALALFLQECGRFEEASCELAASIKEEPNQGTAYYCIGQTTTADAESVAKLESLLTAPMAGEEKRTLHFALAAAYERAERYEESWKEYEEAHRLTYARFGESRYDREADTHRINQMVGTFSRSFMGERRRYGSKSDKPVFVVGMIRSGTTLCEQILSSHPKVWGIGEQLFWPERASAFLAGALGSLDQGAMEALGADYMTLLDRRAAQGVRVLDKMPANHAFLGLIHTVFPEARIIHMRRNPIDTCLSIYTTRINRPPTFGRTQEDIAFAYKQYERVMSHWRSVLPSGSMLEVEYEDLIENGEPIIRQMVEFLGLEWDDACLRHEENGKNVKTPSLWAVRKPLNKTSVERWRRFEPWIRRIVENL